MLVLTRKQSETIQIGDSITITVLRMKGKSVRIGIKAPHDMNVIRGELAFEVPQDLSEDIPSEEAETSGETAKPCLRTSSTRQGDSWSTRSEPPAAVAAGFSTAWSI